MIKELMAGNFSGALEGLTKTRTLISMLIGTVGGSYFGGLKGGMIGWLGGTILGSLLEGLFGDDKYDRTMPTPVGVTAEKTVEKHPVKGVTPPAPDQVKPDGKPLPQPQGPKDANAYAPILNALTPPTIPLKDVLQERIQLFKNIHVIKDEADWENAKKNLRENQRKANQFMANAAGYLRNRTQYHAPDGERSKLLLIVGDNSHKFGTRLPAALADRFVPVLPDLSSAGITVDIYNPNTNTTTQVPAEQVVRDYQSGAGDFALHKDLMDYGSVRYLSDSKEYKDKDGTKLFISPTGERMTWSALTTDDKIFYIQTQIVEDMNDLGNGACRKLPAWANDGNACDIDLKSILDKAGKNRKADLEKWIDGGMKENLSNRFYNSASNDEFFATAIQVALEKKNYAALEHLAGTAKARYTNGVLGGQVGKDATLADTYGKIERYAKHMHATLNLHNRLHNYMTSKQAGVYSIYEVLAKGQLAEARQEAMSFLKQRMPVLEESGIAIMNVKQVTNAAECPEGGVGGTAMTFVDTRRPGNLLTTVFGTVQNGKFVITHAWEGDYASASFGPSTDTTAKSYFDNRKLATPITLDAGAMTQLLPVGGAESKALRPVDGKSVGSHLGTALKDIPVYGKTGRWITPQNQNVSRLIEQNNWDIKNGAIPKEISDKGIKADDCCTVTFVDPMRGGKVFSAFGYKNTDGTFLVTHAWEGDEQTLKCDDGKGATWSECKLPAPFIFDKNDKGQVVLREADFQLMPVYLRNRTWEQPKVTGIVRVQRDEMWKEAIDGKLALPQDLIDKGVTPADCGAVTFSTSSRLDSKQCTALGYWDKTKTNFIFFCAWEGDITAKPDLKDCRLPQPITFPEKGDMFEYLQGMPVFNSKRAWDTPSKQVSFVAPVDSMQLTLTRRRPKPVVDSQQSPLTDIPNGKLLVSPITPANVNTVETKLKIDVA